jgi:hypothetical protein
MGCNTTFRGETKKAAYEAGLFVRVGSISGFRAGSVAKYPPGPAHTLERFCTTISRNTRDRNLSLHGPQFSYSSQAILSCGARKDLIRYRRFR